ncbi:hypothetical protein [Inhella proteolytica]|uniref:Uncharacterized protein n=1 Tax=Inhella proteolytica TaxID=2795029 RepID=A0A931NEV8_9BURK|nr:hypothetical protein [Inhella proteolytica]MBH9578117.1 hypothetical protein [Inhella proteolytica]
MAIRPLKFRARTEPRARRRDVNDLRTAAVGGNTISGAACCIAVELASQRMGCFTELENSQPMEGELPMQFPKFRN